METSQLAAFEDAEEIVCASPGGAADGLLRVDTRRLLKGMFVAELDRPWSDTPLPQSGVLVETDEELQAIRHYCQFVMVDPARSSDDLLAAIRAAAVLSSDRALVGDDIWSKPATAGQGAGGHASGARDARGHAAGKPPHQAERAGGEPRPRDDVRPSVASRARILRLLRVGEQRAEPPQQSPLSQFRRWLGLARPSAAEDFPDTQIQRHRAALQALRDTWGDAIGAFDHGNGAPIRESIALARPAHARLVAAGDSAIRQVRQGTALAFGPLAEAADAFAAGLVASPEAMRWLDAVYASTAATPNPAIGTALRLADFGRGLGMPLASLRELALIGLLADIGKALLPRDVLEHPGVLNPRDYALMQQHVTMGLDILSRSSSVPEAVTAGIAEHHERLDGSGYPRGLRGTAISLHGRMAGIVDTFSALTAARAYANPLSVEDALSALHEWSGSLFCRALVEQFILVNGAFPVGSLVELQSGEIAAVVGLRPGTRLQPKLVMMTAADKGPLRAQGDQAARRDAPPGDRRAPVRIARGLPAGAFGLRLKDYFSTQG